MNSRPKILCIAGHDPTGGAGIQADLETIHDLGGQACSIVTALTVQDSSNLYNFQPVATDLITRQFQCLTRDITFQAIKIGLIGNINLIQILASLIKSLPQIPVIVDPVLAAGGGTSVANQAFIQQLAEHIYPVTTLLTPNIPEAQKLSGLTDADDCAARLLQQGCKNILITGTHEEKKSVVNRLYSDATEKISLESPRLPHTYHGSGCTLSSAISYFLASKHSLTNAVKLAQEYTLNTLTHADQPGHGQYFPVRNSKLWQ